MSFVLPDTSVWVSLIRRGTKEEAIRRGLRGRALYLSSVVVHELYRGCRTEEDWRDIDFIRQSFDAAKRIVAPTFQSWYEAANILGRYSRVHGSVNWNDHLLDILILLCAVQLRARVLTLNVADFNRWNQLIPAGRRVRVQAL